jgi:hypothetical protein
MRARRFVLAVTIATFLALAAQSPASANISWCFYDPPVQVTTPGGENLTVNTFVYFSPTAKHQTWKVTSDASAASNEYGGTTVTVNVYVPAGAGPVHVVATIQKYSVTEEQDGIGGTTMTFTLDVPAD